jgi:dihydrofolate reductase
MSGSVEHLISSVPELVLVVAMDRGGLIGNHGGLPWHLPADLRRFKAMTMGHALVMGRKTFDSIGRCLPGRTTIIVTRQANYRPSGARIAHSWEQAVQLSVPHERVCVVGGAEVYALALPHVNRLWVTHVEAHCAGDVYFPESLDWTDWCAVREEECPADEKNSHATRFVEYVRWSGDG